MVVSLNMEGLLSNFKVSANTIDGLNRKNGTNSSVASLLEAINLLFSFHFFDFTHILCRFLLLLTFSLRVLHTSLATAAVFPPNDVDAERKKRCLKILLHAGEHRVSKLCPTCPFISLFKYFSRNVYLKILPITRRA